MATNSTPGLCRKRVFEIIEIGAPDDYVSRMYDLVNSLAIVVNLVVSPMCSPMPFPAYGGLPLPF